MNRKDSTFISASVLEALEDELAYQTALPPERADDEDHGYEGQVITLERYVRKVIDAWVDNPGNEASQHEMRKVAAIAIRALILYGCPRRNDS